MGLKRSLHGFCRLFRHKWINSALFALSFLTFVFAVSFVWEEREVGPCHFLAQEWKGLGSSRATPMTSEGRTTGTRWSSWVAPRVRPPPSSAPYSYATPRQRPRSVLLVTIIPLVKA